MARSIEDVQPVECKLLEWDEAGDDMVIVRPARTREHRQRDRLFSRTMVERDTDEGTLREIYDWPGAELVILECWLTFVDSNLKFEKKVKKGDKEETVKEMLFWQGMSEAEFRTSFDKLDAECVQDWHRQVRKVNPQWDPRARGEQAKK